MVSRKFLSWSNLSNAYESRTLLLLYFLAEFGWLQTALPWKFLKQ